MNIEGDERVKVTEPAYIDVPIGSNKTIGEIRSELEAKVRLKTDSYYYYCFYDWRMDGENGEEMQSSTRITEDITVYARTNYRSFKLSGNTLEGYEGEEPRGRIFIPKNIEIIKNKAFENCDGLKAVDLTDCSEITEIGSYAFGNCRRLESIDLSPCSKLQNLSGFSGCSKLKSVDLSGCSELTEIGSGAFRNCSSLESIDLSPCTKLTRINAGTFGGCSKLKSVDLSDCSELTEIDSDAFRNYSSLESIDLSPCTKLTRINAGAFLGCSKLKSVDLSGCAEITEIDWSAFRNCSSLESIDLSPCTKLTEIRRGAFNGCTKAVVKLPMMNLDTLRGIDRGAFGEDYGNYCKKVLVTNESAKRCVIYTGYPENQIEIY